MALKLKDVKEVEKEGETEVNLARENIGLLSTRIAFYDSARICNSAFSYGSLLVPLLRNMTLNSIV